MAVLPPRYDSPTAGPGATIGQSWPLLASLVAIFFINIQSRLGFGPLLPVIEQDLGLRHAQSGSLFLFISMGYGPGLFLSPFLAARLSYRDIVVVSSASTGLALWICSLTGGLWSLRAALLLMGLTSGLYLPSGVAALTSAVRKKDWGKVLSLHQLAPNLAYVAAPLAADLLLRLYPWRTALRFYGAAAVFLGLMFWLEKKAGRYHGVAPNARRIFKLLLHPPFLVLILVFSLAVGVNQGVFQMMSLYLSVERDMTPGAANRLISLSRLIALLAPLVGGWIADRVGLKKTTSVVVLGSGASTLGVVLAGPQWILAVLILQAVFSACYFPLGFAAMSQMSTPETRNLAVGLVVPAAHLFGAGFIPTAVGAAADAGYFGLGFMILGGVTAASVFLIRFLDTD